MTDSGSTASEFYTVSYHSKPCPNCGIYGAVNTYCLFCGTWISDDEKNPEIKYCPYCGRKLPNKNEE